LHDRENFFVYSIELLQCTPAVFRSDGGEPPEELSILHVNYGEKRHPMANFDFEGHCTSIKCQSVR
jgi:hypothetical protein